jgi:hypothetical protein
MEPLNLAFQRLLDTSYIRQVCQYYQIAKEIRHCSILQTHFKEFFKPESKYKSLLAVAYQLDFDNNQRQLIYVKGFHGGYSDRAFKELETPPNLHIPELDILLWIFPKDPVLPHLHKAVKPEYVINHLPLQTSRVEISIVNYRPEIRCTAWYQLDHEMLFGKIYADHRYKDIYQRLDWMWSNRDDNSFLMAPLAGFNDEIKTFWQFKLEGQALIDYLTINNYHDLMHKTAQRLHFLNTCAMPCPERENNQAQLKEVNKKIKKLKHVFPELEVRLSKLENTLVEGLTQLEPFAPMVVHGDFHLRQMLVHQDQIALFDFDECSLGDPIEDLGHFIADLYTYSFETSFIEALTQAFLKAYSQIHQWDIPSKRLNWHLQIQLINRAYRNYLQQKPNLVKSVEATIGLAENMCHTQKIRPLEVI